MHSTECPWCRADTKRMKDEDIIKQFDQAIARNNKPCFQATMDPLMHTQYHKNKAFGIQHADAMDAVNITIERLWRWIQRKSPDGKHIVSQYYSMNLGWKNKMKKTRIGGEVPRIIQRNSKQWEDQVEACIRLKREHRITRSLQDLLEDPTVVVDLIPSPNAGPDTGTDGYSFYSRPVETLKYGTAVAIERLYRLVQSAKGTSEENSACTTIFKAVAHFAQDCLKKDVLPILFSQGLRIPSDNGTSNKLLMCRLGCCLSWTKRLHVNPLKQMKERIPSLTLMGKVLNKDFYPCIQQLPEWETITQNTTRQRVNRAYKVLIEQNVLRFILYPVKGDDNDILYMS